MCACAFVIYDEVEMETFDSTISVSFFVSDSNTCYHSHTVWVTHSLSHPLMLFLSCTVHARNRIRLVKNRNSFDSNHNKRLQRHGSKRSNECDCSGNSLKLKQSTAFIHCQCRLFLLFQHSRSCLAKTMCWKKEFSMVLHEFHWVQWTAMHSVKWINVFKWNQISIWTRLILTSFFSGKFENDCIKNRCLRGNRKRMASVLL